MTQDRKSGGRTHASLERVEALLDEAVGQAAKGSYREAAEKAQEALALDPDNAAARDLLDSYRRQVTDDEERRRRRRSIAAAAAAIEEMVENDRLEEASSATDALVMQFGVDAPVEDLRRRIAEARAELLDFDDLDAAIDSIRITEARPSQAGRTEPGGAIAAEVEEHLRAGRLEEASRAVSRLEREPDATERALKLRTRVEEAMHVAAEHRREEEILIATAAIEERIRRGNVDDAAERLADLTRRHGDSAPVAELGQRLAEARALREQKVVAAAEAEVAPEPVSTSPVSAPVFASMVGDESSSGRGKTIAIAAVVVALGAGAWWLLQRGDETPAPGASEPAATVASRADEGLPPAVPAGSQPSTADPDEPSTAEDSNAPLSDPAPAVPSTPQQNAAAAPAVAPPRTQADNPPPTAVSEVAAAPPTVAPQAPPSVSAQDPPALDNAQNASASGTAADAPAQPSSAPETAEVVVEAVPVAEIPPPPPPAAVAPPPASPPPVVDAAPAPAESAAQAPPSQSEPAPPPPPAASQPAAVAEAPRAAAPAAASGPAILGCGDPGVVCVKAIQVPQPRYPAAARARRLSGSVVVMALVNEQGRVVQARVDSGSFAFFNDAALDAARRATFQPATRQGVPGQSWARLTYRFDEP